MRAKIRETRTWWFDPGSCTLWGLELRSIILWSPFPFDSWPRPDEETFWRFASWHLSPRSSAWLGLSPGNYTTHTHCRGNTHSRSHYKEANSKPQSSVLAIESACEFSCRQHEQPCRIVDKEKYRLSHSKRRLYKKKKKTPRKKKKLSFTKHESGSIPGAFSHMSQLGALLGSAKPTRTCRLASLLHIWTWSQVTKCSLTLL